MQTLNLDTAWVTGGATDLTVVLKEEKKLSGSLQLQIQWLYFANSPKTKLCLKSQYHHRFSNIALVASFPLPTDPVVHCIQSLNKPPTLMLQ